MNISYTHFQRLLNALYDVWTGSTSLRPPANTWQVTKRSELDSWQMPENRSKGSSMSSRNPGRSRFPSSVPLKHIHRIQWTIIILEQRTV